MVRSCRKGIAVLMLVLPTVAAAVPAGYTSLASFQAASSSFVQAQTLNFDALAVGALIPSGSAVDGLTFQYSLSGSPTLQVDTGFPTTSGTQYLGLDNGNGAFYTGTSDGFTVSFDHLVDAVGLYILAGSAAAGDFTLSAGGGSVQNSALADVSFADGSHGYYLGLVAAAGDPAFGSFTLGSNGATAAFYAFNVDDISSAVSPVPEPPSWLLGLAASWLLLWRARAQRAQRWHPAVRRPS